MIGLQQRGSFSMGCSVHFADGLGACWPGWRVERPGCRCATATGPSACSPTSSPGGTGGGGAAGRAQPPVARCSGGCAWPGTGRRRPGPGERLPVALVGERSALEQPDHRRRLAERKVAWRSAAVVLRPAWRCGPRSRRGWRIRRCPPRRPPRPSVAAARPVRRAGPRPGAAAGLSGASPCGAGARRRTRRGSRRLAVLAGLPLAVASP